MITRRRSRLRKQVEKVVRTQGLDVGHVKTWTCSVCRTPYLHTIEIMHVGYCRKCYGKRNETAVYVQPEVMAAQEVRRVEPELPKDNVIPEPPPTPAKRAKRLVGRFAVRD